MTFKAPSADPQSIVSNGWDPENSDAVELLFTDPATQTVTGASYTNSQSTTLTESVGFNQSQGFNASVSESTTVGSSQTVSVPPIQIVNQSDVATGDAAWDFTAANNALPAGADFTPQTQWLWIVNREDYSR